MTMKEIAELVHSCTYKLGWYVNLRFDETSLSPISPEPGRPYLQLYVVGTLDSVTGEPTVWRSGKKYLSRHMCRQEIVGAVFGLIKDAEMHEVHEWFRYKGASIFNQHLDPDVLAEVAKKKSSFNVREDAMLMGEAA